MISRSPGTRPRGQNSGSPARTTEIPLLEFPNPASRNLDLPLPYSPLLPLADQASGPSPGSSRLQEREPRVASSSASMEPPERRFCRPCYMTSKARHLTKVYAMLIILLGAAFAQLLTMRYLDFDFGKVVSNALASTSWMLMALVCFMILACVNLTNTCPINYFLAVAIVESTVCFMACERWSKLTYTGCVVIITMVVLINILLHILGIFLPLKLQPGAVAVLVITILYIIIVATIFIIVYFNGNIYLLRYFSMISLAYSCIIVQFTVTVVHQRRVDFLTRNDYVLQATILAFLCVYMCHASIVVIRFGQFLVDQTSFQHHHFISFDF
ncbi:uncharacterized protein [Drosophila bipectinata]|uniref:uncharacterized protein n=1 Tax=Drosophila bipectinata TaxID=42026 RepID=UPI001C89012A|nr:uncharacterized protein LOC108130430 [Drosophila bipectinata]